MTEEELNKKVDEILGQMSVKEKIALCSGEDYWHTKAFAKYGVPSVMMTDGPHGLRRELQGPGEEKEQAKEAVRTPRKEESSAPETEHPKRRKEAESKEGQLLQRQTGDQGMTQLRRTEEHGLNQGRENPGVREPLQMQGQEEFCAKEPGQVRSQEEPGVPEPEQGNGQEDSAAMESRQMPGSEDPDAGDPQQPEGQENAESQKTDIPYRQEEPVLRQQEPAPGHAVLKDSAPATCFPPAVTAAQTWNRHLIYEEGRAIGEEAKEAGLAVVLGPGVNIKRNPLCGRNFEYYSEDPYVAGEIGAAFVSGVQLETGIGTSLKHYACNSQEYCRLQSDSQMDERTLREIYLRAFEKVVKKSQPATVMCAYNRVNGTYCSDSRRLLTDILRGEWGFQGAVVTDWGALNDRTEAFRAGCDLVMPGGSAYGEKEARRALRSGELSEEDVDQCARRVLRLVLRRSAALEKARDYSYDRTSHRITAQRIAEEGAVLLKNNDHILPIKDAKDVVLIGAMAADMRYQGGGSSHVNAERLRQVRECMPQAAFVEGCDADGKVTEESLLEVTRAARRAKKAVVFAGLPEVCESEGYDRKDLELPVGHNRMVRAALAGNPQTIVVLMGGGVMKLPWFDDVAAVLYAGLCGQEGGQAIANILTGKVNPSGKLTETWPLEETDIPSYGYYSDSSGSQEAGARGRRDAQYREGIYVGYRYYDKAGRHVRFPFGYGLSYTEFAYTGMKIQDRQVSVRVRNVGMVPGSEVVQLYVGNPQDGIFRPVKELRAFEKVNLKPLEETTVCFHLAERDFAVYQDGWKVPSGTYTIMAGSSSADIRLSQAVVISGEEMDVPVEFEDPRPGSWYMHPTGQPSVQEWRVLMGGNVPEPQGQQPGSFDRNSSILDMAPYSRINRRVLRILENYCAKNFGAPGSASYRMALETAAGGPLRSLKMFAPRVPMRVLRFLVKRGNAGRGDSRKL